MTNTAAQHQGAIRMFGFTHHSVHLHIQPPVTPQKAKYNATKGVKRTVGSLTMICQRLKTAYYLTAW